MTTTVPGVLVVLAILAVALYLAHAARQLDTDTTPAQPPANPRPLLDGRPRSRRTPRHAAPTHHAATLRHLTPARGLRAVTR